MAPILSEVNSKTLKWAQSHWDRNIGLVNGGL